MGGGGWPGSFFAGGRVDPADSKIDRVKLRFGNGLALHDDASEEVALVIIDERMTMQATVVMIDPADTKSETTPPFPSPDTRQRFRFVAATAGWAGLLLLA